MLNKSQKKAVESTANNILILAGAGSGKTTTLISRVAYLINTLKISGHNILCITFTRKAAQELKERLSKMIPNQELYKITVGTFHSVSLDIIKKFGHLIGYKRESLTVYNEDDQKEIMNYVINTGSYKIKKRDLNNVLYLYSTEETLPDSITGINEDIKIIFNEYRTILKENNSLDYSMILCECNRLIREFQQVYNWVNNKFKYVHVDEYQDTNLTQYNLHELIHPENLFCIGDDFQSIYGWRGSKIDIILNFEKDHPDSKIYYLEENYRSGKNIVEAGNRLIKHNKNQFDKKLIAQKDIKDDIQINNYTDIQQFSNKLVKYIKQYISAPFTNFSDICVLSRKHSYLKDIVKVLKAKDIPCLYVGSQNKFFNQPEVKLINAYLHLFYNPADNLNFMRIMKAENISKADYIKIRQQALEKDKGHFEIYKSIPEQDALCGCIDLNIIPDDKFSIVLKSLVFYFKTYGLIRNESVEEIGNKLIEIAEKNNIETLEDYIKWYSLRDIQDELAAEKKDCVKLMTAHASKGLEFKTVFIAGCMEDCFPLKSGDLEEERRLMYVAITRAIKNLYLSYWNTDTGWKGQGEIKRNRSQFCGEINNGI